MPEFTKFNSIDINLFSEIVPQKEQQIVSDYIGYIPVPTWNGNVWIPQNYAENREMEYPKDFDPTTLKPPRFNIGDHITFKWGDGTMKGIIKHISLPGGAYTQHDMSRYGCEAEIAKERYFKAPCYTVYANGHGRWVDERNIIS